MNIEYNPKRTPIAHEVIFPENKERNLPNSFRFVLMSLLYHHSLTLGDVCRPSDSFTYSSLYYNLALHNGTRGTIKVPIVKVICKRLKTTFKNLLLVAIEFSKHTEINCVTFASNDKAILMKGFKLHFGV